MTTNPTPDTSAPTPPTLTPEQRRNMAARRAELARVQDSIDSELALIAALEAGDVFGVTTPAPGLQVDSLTPACDSCGSTENVMPDHHKGALNLYCPRCAASAARVDAAEAHLIALLWPAFSRWCRHWHAAGLEPIEIEGVWESVSTYWAAGIHQRPGGIKQAIDDALNEQPAPAPTAPN